MALKPMKNYRCSHLPKAMSLAKCRVFDGPCGAPGSFLVRDLFGVGPWLLLDT